MLTSLGERSLVVDNGDVLLGQVGDSLVLDLPQVLGDLRDKSCMLVWDRGAEWSHSRKSCETITTPPSNSLMAAANESMEAISKWFVGSSSSKMCGCSMARMAKTTLHVSLSEKIDFTTHRLRRPSESWLIGLVW